MKNIRHFLIFLYSLFTILPLENARADDIYFDLKALEHVPVAYKGRFRPMDAYARLWLYDLYHEEQIRPQDRQAFQSNNGSALEFLLSLHFLGHGPWDNAPLFWLSNNTIKNHLGLNTSDDHFSYSQLRLAIYENPDSNLRFLQPLLINFFLRSYRDPSNRSHSEKQELTSLSSGLWVMMRGDDLILAAAPRNPPWNHLKSGMVLAKNSRFLLTEDERKSRQIADDSLNLLMKLSQYGIIGNEESASIADVLRKFHTDGYSPQQISNVMDLQYPLMQRLQSDSLFLALPRKQAIGSWLPLKALNSEIYNSNSDKLISVSNFTLYEDTLFKEIQSSYIALELAIKTKQPKESRTLSRQLADHLKNGYSVIAGTPYQTAAGKMITYPSLGQLQAELWFYHYPFTTLTLIAYIAAACLFVISMLTNKSIIYKAALACFATAFIIHTSILILRCYILQRPPVSNMYETVIYVPWITVIISAIFYAIFRNRLLLITSAGIASILLAVLQATRLNNSLENVQAVLDSQYWLIIHVLLVVGSYGVFALCGVLGHLYLALLAFYRNETANMQLINRCVLQTMYLGVAMLIPGTILGGVWAAESWGRFWDWDPKESWAFISICTYLICIHAYRFHYIRNFGLAMGAAIGFLAISFTWYGVNYILGTGLHSYGFGSGGEFWYYLFLIADICFLGWVARNKKVEGRMKAASP